MTHTGIDALRCPTCRARLRRASACTRCGADLTPLLKTALDSYRLRDQARQALLCGDLPRARQLVAAAELRQSTPRGRVLAQLLSCLPD